jgi:RNA polymerase sigma factor (sigma-70 family)
MAMADADANAISRFYNEYFDMMFVEARRASRRDEQFCLDIVQDAMLKVIRSVRPMETESRLAQWTRRLVRNVAYDQLRAEILRKRREANSVPHGGDDRARPELDEMEAQ